MTIVRIVLADPRTGRPPGGSAVNGRQLIVLADTVAAEDGGHRAVPLWLPGLDFKLLWWLLDAVSAPGTARDAGPAGVLEETAARLLHAAGVAVTAVDSSRPARMCWSCARARPRRGSSWARPPEPGM